MLWAEHPCLPHGPQLCRQRKLMLLRAQHLLGRDCGLTDGAEARGLAAGTGVR